MLWKLLTWLIAGTVNREGFQDKKCVQCVSTVIHNVQDSDRRQKTATEVVKYGALFLARKKTCWLYAFLRQLCCTIFIHKLIIFEVNFYNSALTFSEVTPSDRSVLGNKDLTWEFLTLFGLPSCRHATGLWMLTWCFGRAEPGLAAHGLILGRLGHDPPSSAQTS